MHISGMSDSKIPVTNSKFAVDKWEAQMRKGGLELAILAALWKDRLYGLEVLRVLADHDLQVSEGTVYPLMNRLRRDAVVATEWVESNDGPPRKYYSLTNTGRERIRSMNSRWLAFNKSLQNLLEPIPKESRDE